MSVTHNIKGLNNVNKLYKAAAKSSAKSAEEAFNDTVLLADETAKKRSKRVVLQRLPGGRYYDPSPGQRNELRPFQRTGTYRRELGVEVSKSGTFTGKIFGNANYSDRLEKKYGNLRKSAEIAIKEFPDFLKKAYKNEMRKKKR